MSTFHRNTPSESEKEIKYTDLSELCIENALRDLGESISLASRDPGKASVKLCGAVARAIVAIALHTGVRSITSDICELSSETLCEDRGLLNDVKRLAMIIGENTRSSWDSVETLRVLTLEGRLEPEDVKARIGIVENIVSEAQSKISHSSVFSMKTSLGSMKRDLEELRERIRGLEDTVTNILNTLSVVESKVSKSERILSRIVRVFWPLTVVILVIVIIVIRLLLR